MPNVQLHKWGMNRSAALFHSKVFCALVQLPVPGISHIKKPLGEVKISKPHNVRDVIIAMISLH